MNKKLSGPLEAFSRNIATQPQSHPQQCYPLKAPALLYALYIGIAGVKPLSSLVPAKRTAAIAPIRPLLGTLFHDGGLGRERELE